MQHILCEFWCSCPCPSSLPFSLRVATWCTWTRRTFGEQPAGQGWREVPGRDSWTNYRVGRPTLTELKSACITCGSKVGVILHIITVSMYVHKCTCYVTYMYICIMYVSMYMYMYNLPTQLLLAKVLWSVKRGRELAPGIITLIKPAAILPPLPQPFSRPRWCYPRRDYSSCWCRPYSYRWTAAPSTTSSKTSQSTPFSRTTSAPGWHPTELLRSEVKWWCRLCETDWNTPSLWSISPQCSLC